VLLLFALFAFALSTLPVGAQQQQSAPDVVGYVDEDRDGLNDHFRDHDGDGRNDIGQRPYPHHFSFVDADEDGLNDHFRDKDGDGVNDLDGRFIDSDKDGFVDNIIDFEGDNINDITGEKYGPRGLKGYRFGRIFEERGHPVKRFLDEDGDGMHDPFKRLHQRLRMMDRRMDYFFDEDGDGIDDARLLHKKRGPPGLRLQKRSKVGPPRRSLPSGLRQDDPERDKKRRGRK
jgi:hypothetical protein